MVLDFYRVGDKIISFRRIETSLRKALKLRSQGKSQSETAEILGMERSFISRLESLGELRKAKQIGVVGFPVANKEEIRKVLAERGITNCLLMTEEERRAFVQRKPGMEIVNEMSTLIQEYRTYDTVIVLASDMRTKWVESLLDNQVIMVDIGTSPLIEDVYVNPARITEILDHILEKS
jgi:transcriptional regulator with XRE-family HTH domain